MKYLLVGFFSVFLLLSNCAVAQQNHFIYIQTENNQPFYVKLDKQLFSSSVSGYLIIPKLKGGSYDLSIGFPKSEVKEQNFICTIDNNDIGYLFKNFSDKGWGLFNLQSMQVVMAGKVKDNNLLPVDKNDAFSNMLSNVVNDPTIRQGDTSVIETNPLTVKQETKAIPSGNAEKIQENKEASKEALKLFPDGNSKANSGELKDSLKTERITDKTRGDEARSNITRFLINKNADGTEMIYVDDVNGLKDTIRIFIPADKIVEPVVEEKAKVVENPKDTEKPKEVLKDIENKEVKDTGKKFLEMELRNPNSKTEENKPGEVKNDNGLTAMDSNKNVIQSEIKSPMINSDCKKLASEYDFLKLRKRIAAEDNDDGMITISKKSFKSKCFTVEQVKNLSVLFLNDAVKYNFFDMSYPFVSDSQNFPSLQIQLTDNYYINRFQVMIRH